MVTQILQKVMPQQLVAVVELEDELSTVETALQRLVRRAKVGLRRWFVAVPLRQS
jgi:hypothetical protein